MEQPVSVMIKHFSFAKTSLIINVTNWSEAEVDDICKLITKQEDVI